MGQTSEHHLIADRIEDNEHHFSGRATLQDCADLHRVHAPPRTVASRQLCSNIRPANSTMSPTPINSITC
jgi:hypothetical protein